VTVIDSTSRGDPARFRSFDELTQLLNAMPASAKDEGRVALLMRRGEGGGRETLPIALLEPDDGVPGDAWSRSKHRNGDMQIAVMEKGVAELIANGQPLALFGDCLVLDLDLSAGNLPPGSRLRVGEALLEVTHEPHNGCQKYRGRFGADALRLVWIQELRHRNLRGIYMRVVTAGRVKLGDCVNVLSRAVAASTKQAQFGT
jgi:MOSC domain-containing protein YiiM